MNSKSFAAGYRLLNPKTSETISLNFASFFNVALIMRLKEEENNAQTKNGLLENNNDTISSDAQIIDRLSEPLPKFCRKLFSRTEMAEKDTFPIIILGSFPGSGNT